MRSYNCLPGTPSDITISFLWLVGTLSLGCISRGFEGVDSLEANLYCHLLKDFLEGLTPPQENKGLRHRIASLFHVLCLGVYMRATFIRFPLLVNHPLWIIIVA